uniref:Uncharacterized protein n=1 Tax=Anguilla anguilla TaxID=7936 RepID=A0A0E9UAY6_ANGAN
MINQGKNLNKLNMNVYSYMFFCDCTISIRVG